MEIRNEWFGPFNVLEERDLSKKVPVNGERNVLITAALPYVNNVPHLGNIIGCVLSADVFARYCRLKGWRYLYICGTDEYGTATETKAIQENLTPKQICDKYNAIHKEIYDWFNIEFDHFGRTSTGHQEELVQDLFLKLHENGFTTTATIDQLHCENCNRFLADRFAHGECPHCHYDDARGDQCDGCTKLINAIELINPKCQLCNNTPVIKPSTHIFLRLDLLSAEVEKYLDSQLSSPNCHWSTNAVSIAKSWLKNGLEKRCITRDLKWGVPVPLPEFSDKVFYVWFDAPVGYLSITKELLGDDWKLWWKNPDNVELYNFVGKDNVAFHSVMFPASQLAARDNYTIVNQLCATEYLNYEDTKFSKSRGTGVFGDMASETGIDADVWRFYLLYMRPENQDTAFSWDDFALKARLILVNTELLSNLGNFVNRALTFLASNFDSTVQEMELLNPEMELITAVSNEMKEYHRLLESIKFRDALTKILGISRLGNQYMQAMQPWVLCKGDNTQRKRAGTIISVASNIACLLGVLMYPYMPVVSKKILDQCGLEKLPMFPENAVAFVRFGHKIGQPSPLFTKIEKATVDEFKRKFMGGSSTQEKKSVDGELSHNCKLKKRAKKGSTNTVTSLNNKNNAKAMNKFLNYPLLGDHQNTINKLLVMANAKFKQRRELFVKKKLLELNSKKDIFRTEINSLVEKLLKIEKNSGVKQIPFDFLQNGATLLSNDLSSAREFVKDAKSELQKSEAFNLNDDAKKNPKPKKKDKTAKDGQAADVIDVGRLDMRVGRILNAEKHPDADSLYVETIDLGEDKPRTVVSGLVRHVPLDQMQNRLVVCLCNLKPVKMRGVESCAMVMCASCPEKVEILEVPGTCFPGQQVTCSKYTHRPDPIMNPKKKVWETVAPDLCVNAEGKVSYKGAVLLVGGKHLITAPTLRNVPVK